MPLPGYYKIHHTDPTELNGEGGFYIEPQTVNGPLHPLSMLPSKGQNFGIDTSLVLYGKGVPNYGERIADNFLNLLENYACPVPPSKPINGQLWYDTGISFKVHNILTGNRFTLVGNAEDVINEIITHNVNNPANKKSINVINVDALDDDDSVIIGILPKSVSLVSGNTLIEVFNSPFSFILQEGRQNQSRFTTMDTNRHILKIWNKKTTSWDTVNAAFVGAEEPNEPKLGELWIDTSNSPAVIKFYDGISFSSDILTINGGTMTGSLLLAQSPVDEMEAVNKGYVDSELDDITGRDGSTTIPSIKDINTTVEALQLIIDQMDIDSGGLTIRVSNNETAISNHGSAITDLQDTKYDKTGGVVTGNVEFRTPQDSIGNGIDFAYDSTSNLGDNKFSIKASGQNNTSTTLDLLMVTSDTSPVPTTIRIFHSDTITDTAIISFASTETITGVEIYKQFDTNTPIDYTKDMLITLGESTQELNLRGNVITGGNFTAGNMLLTLNTLNLGTNQPTSPIGVDFSHTHELDEGSKYTAAEDSQLYENLPAFIGAPGSQVPVPYALRKLDNDTVSKRTPLILDNVDSYIVITPVQTSGIPNNAVDISTVDFTNNSVRVGDDIHIVYNGAVGFNIISYTGVSITSSTPLSWPAAELNGPPLSCTFIVNGELSFVVSITPSIVSTVQQLINTILLKINASSQLVTATVSPTGITFTSTEKGARSNVEIHDGGIFYNLFAGLPTPIYPDGVLSPFYEYAGLEGDSEAIQGQRTIMAANTTSGVTRLTLSSSVSGMQMDTIWVPSMARTPQQLTSRKYVEKYVDEVTRKMDIIKDPSSIGNVSLYSGTSFLFTNSAPVTRAISGGTNGTRFDVIATGSADVVITGVPSTIKTIKSKSAATYFYFNGWYTIGGVES